MQKKKSSICVLTIHKGSIEELKKTIYSVDTQSIEPIKHIILAKEICNYQIHFLKKKNREFILNKKNDKSVFHGMNIVKKYSINYPIIYLNSGDIFLSRNVIYYIDKFNHFFNLNYILIFSTLLRANNFYFQIKDLFFNNKIYLPHSSFLCKNNYFNQKINFDTKFKISADGIWMKKIISRSRMVKKIAKNIVIQNLYGQSSLPSLKTYNWRLNESFFSGIKELIKLLISKFVSLNVYFLIIYYRKYKFFQK
jgi:hypothetical protein